MQPFWGNDYKEDGYYAFGNPSIEVIEQTKNLPPNCWHSFYNYLDYICCLD
ncbi:hypothetical protein [Lysinibacillus sp. NPDC056185]|uniref:hypothetical protein n=1 Tax=Lysinibacillus sp. NPDC056185 TaxID=3345739 RepID=UPI0039F031C3